MDPEHLIYKKGLDITLWEDFHENTKLTRYDDFLPTEVVVAKMGSVQAPANRKSPEY